MNKKLKAIQTTFIVSIVSLTTISVLALGIILYATNAIEVRQNITSNQLYKMTSDYPAVEAYLQSQKKAEPHFIKIVNIVKHEQQRLLANALLFTGLPVLFLSAILAYALARKLINPVKLSFEAQERFLQDASHEMRNPLAALYAVVQNARNTDDPKEIKKALNTLDRQTQQMVKLNEDLLLLERSKTSNDKAVNQNVSNLLLDVIDSVYSQAQQNSIKIKTKINPDINMVISDIDWVCIARNLIENAIKYSKSGKAININLYQTKQQTILEVIDRGIGIPAEQLNNVGERFYRSSNVGRVPGTGLGMAIVKQIVNSYKAIIKIESAIGKGTTITVNFPNKQ